MATYKNYLKRANGTPILGAQACLYNTDGQRLDVDITEENGLFYFLNVATGHYQVRFFGRNLTEDDWLEIDVVDEFGTGQDYPEIRFVTTPYLGVVEKDSKVVRAGEMTSAEYTITNLETSQGEVASASIYFRADSDDAWQLLDNLDVDEGSLNTDDTLTTITGVAELELPEKPTLFHFKAQFFNPVGIIASVDGTPVEPTSLVTFYGITDVDEYIGVSNFVTKNTISVDYGRYYAIPQDELICSWDDMKRLTGPVTLYNALGNSVEVSEDQLKTIKEYVIFMYISDSDKPSDYPWPYPESSTYGTWYYLMAVSLNRAIVRIPKNKYVKVWVGFKMETTPDTTLTTTDEVKY